MLTFKFIFIKDMAIYILKERNRGSEHPQSVLPQNNLLPHYKAYKFPTLGSLWGK